MSKILINRYYGDLYRAKQFSGSPNETTLRNAFYNLVNGFARPKNLELVTEVSLKTPFQTTIVPDGILRNILQLDYGYWESKDSKDILDKEIEKKFKKGYPQNNILFEDTINAVLFQNNKETKIDIQDSDALLEILNQFVSYERPEVQEFNKVIGNFGTDLPNILDALRQMIEKEAVKNPKYKKQRAKFLQLVKDSINPNLGLADVREMLIQHILTEEIFISIFDNADFHRENNIAETLYELERTFFKGKTKQDLLTSVRPYYNTIKARANEMVSHAEKQKFLKVVYENFYQAYNPKGADRLGIVYTPNEIVKFMLEGTDYLLDKHFSKTLGDKGVQILDPCTGTGTYITELIEHIPPHQLEYKYKNEIHANEMALLPYYVANLNIEAVYQQKMNSYEEFENLCFVDTLDNTQALQYAGKQGDMFGAMSLENVERIKRQNELQISVIMGNPPYNANQMNENDNNKNRPYPDIKKRIQNTYTKLSSASNKANLYDMYVHFYRWASDRMHEDGIIAFITNRSFIDMKAFDGFRQMIQKEFDFAYIIDLGGDIRALSGKDGIYLNETHTIFGVSAAVGIAMMFLIRKKGYKTKNCKIHYIHPCDIRATREEKLNWLKNVQDFLQIPFTKVNPDKNANWVNLTDNDFETLIPICTADVKSQKSNEAIFQLYSLGVNTNRDEWVYDFDKKNLEQKMSFFSNFYNNLVDKNDASFPIDIKWSSSLKAHFQGKKKSNFDVNHIKKSVFRPFINKFHYTEKLFNHRLTQNHYQIFGEDLQRENHVININKNGKDLRFLSSNIISDLHFLGDNQSLPFYRYEEGKRLENITDWALGEFQSHYQTENITKESIFHYVYGVLHNPEYRQKYEQNLKRDFPRIPFYKDFWQWTNWGKELMHLHLNYETAKKYPLKKTDKPLKNPEATPKAKLRRDKKTDEILLDELTTLSNIPTEAWDYKLGNRSALEWILDQYKEKKPRDKTIAEKFNTYRFADYKESVIDLLRRVCTVSMETMRIIGEMEKVKESER